MDTCTVAGDPGGQAGAQLGGGITGEAVVGRRGRQGPGKVAFS